MKEHINVQRDLWDAISSTYEAGNYSQAILAAIHFLSDTIREKTGVDGDGQSLVGQAFGGDHPRLRLNKFQTESEKNEQRGLEQIFRGIYMGIRNPRSHQLVEDSKDTADAIIYFINFLIGIINKSFEPFTIDRFLSQVFDPDFVDEQHYADILVDEIPVSKRLDVLIETFRRKEEGNGDNLKLIVNSIIEKLNEIQIEDFLVVVSEELRNAETETTIRYIIQILPEKLWVKLNEVARLRTEKKLLKSIREGQYIPPSKVCVKGSFGTWALNLIKYFSYKQEVSNIFLTKLQGPPEERNYILRQFIYLLPVVFCDGMGSRQCVIAICRAIRENDLYARAMLIEYVRSFPSDWQKLFASQLLDLTNSRHPAVFLMGGTPFLSDINETTEEADWDEDHQPSDLDLEYELDKADIDFYYENFATEDECETLE